MHWKLYVLVYIYVYAGLAAALVAAIINFRTEKGLPVSSDDLIYLENFKRLVFACRIVVPNSRPGIIRTIGIVILFAFCGLVVLSYLIKKKPI